jgi:hypothetical protein
MLRARREGRRSLGESAAALWLWLALGCSDETLIRLLEPAPGDAAAADDASSPSARDAAVPAPGSGLVLRYDFAGEGTRVFDRAGDADAALLGGAQLDGASGAELDGSDDYVDMPNAIVSRLTSATFMAWLEWHGGVCWQRIFDFGSNDAGEGEVGNGTSALFMTPTNCADGVVMASAEFSVEDVIQRNDVVGDTRLPMDRRVQVALVVDAERARMTLYLDGTARAQAPAEFRLADLEDVNNWLGRSQWVQDLNLAARYDEFRIYDRALTTSEITLLYSRGPDRP